MESSDPRMVVCPSCGGDNLARFDRCFLCDQPLAPANVGSDNPYAAPPPELKLSSRTFTLGSLMLVIALIAVCLGVLVEFPGLGILLALAASFALVRTLAEVSRSKALGRPFDRKAKIILFLGSLGVVTLIGLGSVIAFVVTCFPLGFASFSANSTVGLFIAVGAGIVAAGVSGFYLIRRLWPRRVS